MAAQSSGSAETDVDLLAFSGEITEAGEVQLTPAGYFRSNDGRPKRAPYFYINAEIAAELIRHLEEKARANPIVIDYEHQTRHAVENGKPAPAAGWMTKFEWREGRGLYSIDVDWTVAARTAIRNREYKFISPELVSQVGTGIIIDVRTAGLTNKPAIDGMEVVAARHEPEKGESSVTLAQQLIALLCLGAGSDEAAIVGEVTALKKKFDDASLEVNSLKEKNEALGTEVSALKEQEPDPSKYVRLEVMQGLQKEVSQLRNQLAEKGETEVSALVSQAIEDGRLLPAQKDWALGYGKKDLAGLKSYIESAPEISALKATQTSTVEQPGEGGNAKLTEDEISACRSMGISEEEFLKAKEAK